MNRTKKVLLAIAAVIAALAGSAWYSLTADIRPPSVADLEVTRPDVLETGNAHPFLQEAADVLQDRRRGVSADEWIRKNNKALELIRKAVECERYLEPAVASYEGQPRDLNYLRSLTRLIGERTRVARKANRYGDATDSCIENLRYGKLLHVETETMYSFSMGMECLVQALGSAGALARDPEMPVVELKRLSVKLGKLPPISAGLAYALKSEYELMADKVDAVADGREPMVWGWLPQKMVLHPNRTKLMLANWFRAAVSNAELPLAEGVSLSDHEPRAPKLGDSSCLSRNSVGAWIVATWPQTVKLHMYRARVAECYLRATRLLVAIRLYRERSGTPPAALRLLVPDYIESVPIDPYDGKPFKYDSKEMILYCVGEDLRDSGGSRENPSRAGGMACEMDHAVVADDVVFDL